MPIRSELVLETVGDLLGPKGGIREVLPENPLSEYITGVLQPATLSSESRDLDRDAEITFEDDEDGEEDQDGHEEFLAPVFSPALDPKSRPAALGLSFLVDRKPVVLELCVTWARYAETNVGGTRTWQREPRRWLSAPLTVVGELTIWLGPSGMTRTRQPDSEATLHIRVTDEAGGNRVLLQFVNRISPAETGRTATGEFIFQPSVRVLLNPDTTLLPLRSAAGSEEGRLEFLYRHRPAFARGHMCSATWRGIDPERPLGQRSEQTTLTWADGDLLEAQARLRFLAPHVRTEFVPVYGVQAPSWDWDEHFGAAPEFDAETLAHSCDPATLIPRLEPLVRGYRQWIAERSAEAEALRGREALAADALMAEAVALLGRMRSGLRVLEADADARLCFCFANRAMSLQAGWQNRPMRWRPFQLGFILSILESLVNPASPDRQVCDLLWVPTGGGKTEAYLAVAAFTLAFRRRRVLKRDSGDRSGAGTSVISRYTLRLLTLQQYRRALAMVTACEFLRVEGLDQGLAGWRPADAPDRSAFLWGSARFSIGLWVGGKLTPNRLERFINQPGALDILSGERGPGEPAQVLNCPACNALLAIPSKGLPPGSHRIHLTVGGTRQDVADRATRLRAPHEASSFQADVTDLPSGRHSAVTLSFTLTRPLPSAAFNAWWRDQTTGLVLEPLSAARPGYFPRTRRTRQNTEKTFDFEIWCPSPDCPLASGPWCEGVPADDSAHHAARGGARTGMNGGYQQTRVGSQTVRLDPRLNPVRLRRVIAPWQQPDSHLAASRVPIPALTVDQQVYSSPPSLLIATVDKFAQLAYEPRAGRLFGNAGFFHPWDGYTLVEQDCESFPKLGTTCPPLDSPDLILQDELHLLEGPLGSMVGLYEVAVDNLSQQGGLLVKYIASSATVREADSQVQALFDRRLAVFPPRGLAAEDRFFLRTGEPHPLDESRAGQLFLGVAAPGVGPLKPIYRLWSILLQAAHTRQGDTDFDYFKTLAGYFNAVRELAGARALTRQDIKLHLQTLARFRGETPRQLEEDGILELSSREDSTDLPAILDRLAQVGPEAPDALLATSMFGTGVDVSRLSLMVVHGQPKTTSSYIQAAGRVGRNRAALVVTFLRASRPRDLSHYEFFCGYHRQIYRFVEPITVMPFSPGALDMAAGPVAVALLRNQRGTSPRWRDNPRYIAGDGPQVQADRADLPDLLERRGQSQPGVRAPDPDVVRLAVASELDRWRMLARSHTDLVYREYRPDALPQKPVVLGDAEHEGAGLAVVYENVPSSLREVEATLTIGIGRNE